LGVPAWIGNRHIWSVYLHSEVDPPSIHKKWVKVLNMWGKMYIERIIYVAKDELELH